MGWLRWKAPGDSLPSLTQCLMKDNILKLTSEYMNLKLHENLVWYR